MQLCLEEGFPLEQVARQFGVGFSTLGAWVRAYRAQGEAGLQAKARPRSPRPRVAAAVKRQAVALKRRHPDFGIQKISQFLRRVLLLPVSRETVRRTLHAHDLLPKPKGKHPRRPAAPRSFERALAHKASGFILAHNHPSGDATPSAHDRELTQAVKAAAATVGIRFLDRLIIGDAAPFSFKASGLL